MFSVKNLMVSTNPKGQGGIATVVTGYHEEGLIDELDFSSIHTHSTLNNNKLSAVFTFFISLLKIIYYGVFYKLGVVHIHMASRGSYSRKSKIVRLAKILGAKIVIHLHGAEFETFYSMECSNRKQFHIRNTFDMADKVIVLSSQWLTWVNSINKNNNKNCIVYNAVPELVLPKKTESKNIILFLGRLGKRKGVDDLLHAFARISNNHPNVELHLGGDGDLDFYKKLISDLKLSKQVKLLGWVAGEQKNECLANATVYCLPSYNEGFPMGVLEAMSAGVAVVASTAGGIPDAITNEQEGLLVQAGDVDALAYALNVMLEDEAKRSEYSLAAKTKFQDNFSPSVIVPQLKNIYQKLLENKK